MWTADFWKGLGERAIKTFLQAGLAAAAVDGVVAGTTDLTNVPWLAIASVALVATVFSIATSIGNADFTAGSAGLVGTIGVKIDPKGNPTLAQTVAEPSSAAPKHLATTNASADSE